MTTPKLRWTKILPLGDITTTTSSSSTPIPRSSHGLSFIPSQPPRLVLYGGENQARIPLDPHESTWIAESSTDESSSSSSWKWHRILPSSKDDNNPPPRVAHAQAVINNRVYIFGGRQGITMNERPLNDMWTLDCSSSSKVPVWSKVEYNSKGDSPPPPQPRSFHRMIAIDTDLYVYGGCGMDGRLNDMHKFDTTTGCWMDLGKSDVLAGRGGANLVFLNHSRTLAIVAGFCGKETNDGQRFSLSKKKEEGGSWEDGVAMDGLDDLRPRSVCVSGSFSSGMAFIFGGEVDPSDRGHEGAGSFENDLVLLDGSEGKLMHVLKKKEEDDEHWPEKRGWSDGDVDTTKSDGNSFYIFGGLTGDDTNPIRLNDLWRCDVEV